MMHLKQDVQFGARVLWRNRSFSLLAILCLTLGIGANAAVFSWIEGILLRPFPLVSGQDRLMAIAGSDRGVAGSAGASIDLSWPDFQDLQKNCNLFDAFIVDRITGTTLTSGDRNRAESVTASIVSANYFDALGVHPILGRGFEPVEDFGRNGHPVAVISYQMWKERFHGDPEIIGKTQALNGVVHTIIGVAPEKFYGTFVGWAMQFWVPVSMQEIFDPGGYKLEDRGARWIEGFVRRKPGVTAQQAQAEISAVAKRLEDKYPTINRGRGVRLFPLWATPFNNAGTLMPTLEIAAAVAVFILLIACANVGNLLLVRSFARRQEISIRLAIGAGRGSLIAQLLTEALLLSAIAAALGLAVAVWCRNLPILLFPPRGGVAMHLPGEIDWRVLAAGAGVCIVSTLLFALVPAFQAGKVDVASVLKSEAGGVVGQGRRAFLRSSLVLVQVSLSFVLLVGAVLLFQSLRGIRNTSPGFSMDGVLTTSINLNVAGYDTERAKSFEDQLIDRLDALSGVSSAAFARFTPLGYRGSSAPIAVDGYLPAPDEQPSVEYNEVGPSYFATMGIALARGRDFTRADNETALPVAVVNEAMVSQYWRGEDAMDKRLQVKGRWFRVVGVSRNSKYRSLLEKPKPFFYVPLRQSPSGPASLPGQNLNIRTSADPGSMLKTLVREIHAFDPNLAPSELITMREQVDRTMAPQRFGVMMLGVFGGLAVLLAAIGLYGVMSYTVSQSARELALRLALGATRPELLRLVLSRGMTLTAGGVFLGIAASAGLTRLLVNLLYNESPRDPLAFAAAFGVMTIASFAACLVPAWRATQADPVQALRT